MKSTLLWRISPGKGQPDSYLFGTMHVRASEAFSWLPAAQDHIKKCEVFATEFDFAEADSQALTQALTLPEDQTLDRLLPRNVWKNLERYCHKYLAIPAEALVQQHPMGVSMLLTNALMSEEAPASLDETLWQYARKAGKPVTGVETFVEQLQILQKIPFQLHVKNLTWLLKNFGRQKRRVQKMLRWYENGDIRQLYHSAKKDARGMRKILLYERNQLMVKRFVQIAQQQSLFCAVGAGHLSGQKGMLRLLKKEGFSVTPVR